LLYSSVSVTACGKTGDYLSAKVGGEVEDREMAMARDPNVLRIIPVLMAVCLGGLPARAKDAGPSGAAGAQHQIWTAGQTNDSDTAAHPGYVIITTSGIQAISSVLPEFVCAQGIARLCR
jgi:hypothetical protein